MQFIDDFYKVEYRFDKLVDQLLDHFDEVSPFMCACHSVNLEGPIAAEKLDAELVSICHIKEEPEDTDSELHPSLQESYIQEQTKICQTSEIRFDEENDFPQILIQNHFLNAWHKTDRALTDPKIMFIIRFNLPNSL